MDMSTGRPPGAVQIGQGEGGYKWYVAAVLGLAHTVAIIDRFVMVLVTEPIRAAMHLTDTQLGMLQGTGFALLYCGFAIPLGAMADATSRRNLIAIGLVMWSLATMAAAFTTSFGTLFATRVLVGMGEACLIPAGMSLLTAYFAPSNLARGTAIFGLGANFGYGLAFLGGGALLAALVAAGGLALPGVTLMPWQAIFLLAGGLALPVLLMLAFVREPHRPPVAGRGLGPSVAAMREGLGYLFAHLRGYAPFLLIGALTAVTGYAVTSWSSSLFVRIHGMAPADAGKLIGLIGVIAGPLGTIVGGWLLDRLRTRGVVGAPMLIMGGGCLIALATSAAVGHAASLPLATLFFCVFMFGSTFTLPALYVGMQLLTPDRYRGIAASFNMMIYTLAGLGLGPTTVGAISDALGGEAGLAHAVVIVEAAMALVIVPTALLARRAYHARSLAVAAG
ncbi:MFS transporter [Rhizorhabdus wittichii]|uniref:MFS transporter n=1 Tax=Rhizorhabdus wittichii TaxID=160791 RepID=A0A975HFB6_9SPHN|nr:MFS transporter [Rhizorhabdus wittichii]QTH23386.1 MFS transporter [Rhizorhabdus wittichii]